MAVTRIPLVNVINSRNESDQDYLFALSNKFREHFPNSKIAYIVPERGYDTEEIHRTLYEQCKIIPIIVGKKTAYPKSYTAEGIPLCIWGFPMSRTCIDYTRKRTR
jgi:hypothetical protein